MLLSYTNLKLSKIQSFRARSKAILHPFSLNSKDRFILMSLPAIDPSLYTVPKQARTPLLKYTGLVRFLSFDFDFLCIVDKFDVCFYV